VTSSTFSSMTQGYLSCSN